MQGKIRDALRIIKIKRLILLKFRVQKKLKSNK